jgi:hypothetical protein
MFRNRRGGRWTSAASSSFGIVLHEMLAGAPLFRGPSPLDTPHEILHAGATLPALPEGAEDVQRCLD